MDETKRLCKTSPFPSLERRGIIKPLLSRGRLVGYEKKIFENSFFTRPWERVENRERFN
jgi:hypothetical protein